MVKLSFLDGIDDLIDQSHAAHIVASPPKLALVADGSALQQDERDITAAQLKAIENELFDDALQVSADMLAFRELDPSNMNDIPPDWVDRYGEERAHQRFRVARAAWMKTSEAPAALKHATTLAVGIMRARSSQKSAPRNLNISIVQLTQQPQQPFRELEVEK